MGIFSIEKEELLKVSNKYGRENNARDLKKSFDRHAKKLDTAEGKKMIKLGTGQ